MLFSQPIMENQIQSTNQVRANIMRQQPVNTTESVTSASIPKPTLEERIRTMKSLTKLIPTSTPISQSYAIDLTGNCINRSISITNKTSIIQCQPTTIMANVSNVLSSSTSQTLIQSSSSPIATSIPVLIAPKKSSHSFLQRFTAKTSTISSLNVERLRPFLAISIKRKTLHCISSRLIKGHMKRPTTTAETNTSSEQGSPVTSQP